jgi:hypothetical protein
MEKLLFAKRFQFRLGASRLDFAAVGHNAGDESHDASWRLEAFG